MAFAGNLLWFIFGGGIFACLGWLLLGLLLCCTVVGIPFGIAAFRIASFAAFPFGKELVSAEMIGEERITGTGLANFLWIILAGLWLAISHALVGVACLCLFVLVFPVFWGMAHFKLAAASFAPLGKRIVSTDMAKIAKSRSINKELDRKLCSKQT